MHDIHVFGKAFLDNVLIVAIGCPIPDKKETQQLDFPVKFSF